MIHPTGEPTIDEIYENITEMVAFVKAQGRRSADVKVGKDEPVCDAAETERAVFSRLLAIGRLAMEAYFEELGPGDEGTRLPLNEVDYERRTRSTTTLQTVFGGVPVERYGYYAAGHPYIWPTAWRANLPERSCSYFAQQIIDQFSLQDTYQESVDWFAELFGISVSTRTADDLVLEMSEYHGEFADAVEAPPVPDGRIQVVSFDGKGVPIRRAEAVGRRPSRLRPGEKRQKKKEALVGIEYVAEPHLRQPVDIAQSLVAPEELSAEQQARVHGRAGDREIYYQASIAESKEDLMREIRDRLDRKGNVEDRDMVILMDGQAVLWKLADELFPEAEKVLDIIHVTGYLWDAANAIFYEGSPDAKALVKKYLTTILQGRVGHVIGGLRQRIVSNNLKWTRKGKVETTIGYLENNRERMHYKKCLAKGYPIASGVVESACGHLVKDRMEKSGARWIIEGAEAMLRLRSIYKNGDWHEYQRYRQTQEAARLYPEFEKAA